MAKHLRITGRVQGVGYRATFETQARALKLAGWVRNRPDGSVEAMVRGDRESLHQIITWAHRGPPSAAVREVSVLDIDDAMVPGNSFEMRQTQ